MRDVVAKYCCEQHLPKTLSVGVVQQIKNVFEPSAVPTQIDSLENSCLVLLRVDRKELRSEVVLDGLMSLFEVLPLSVEKRNRCN